MENFREFIELLEETRLLSVLRACAFVLVGFVLSKLVSLGVYKAAVKHASVHNQIVFRRSTFYLIFVLMLVSAINQLGFDLSVLLGAAGILTVAIGFASQTSASNLISGLFLMVERPFSITDVIRVGGTTGEVISIDLLSVKIRTFDNLFVRIPNETMLKSEVVTLTKFAIRRVDLMIGVAYKENIDVVKDVLMDIANKNPLCLSEPPPMFIFTGFGNSSVDIQFSVWARRENLSN